MSFRHVFGVMILPGSSVDNLCPIAVMTVILNIDGEVIRSRSEAQRVAKKFVGTEQDFVLEQRFVLYQPDGSPFYFPDPARQFADPSQYPIDIAYGFIVDRDDSECWECDQGRVQLVPPSRRYK